MPNIEKTVTLKALPRERVMARNYRRGGVMEPGEVLEAETFWRRDGSSGNRYRVVLDRESKSGNLLFLHLGDDGIALE